jgi:hypothetical protein
MDTSNISNLPSSDRPIWKRWTVIGGTILVAINYLESQEMIPRGFGREIASMIEHASAVLMGLGLYRHIPSS